MKVVSRAEDAESDTTTGFVSRLRESKKDRLDPSVGHMGVVKKRGGQFNAAYKNRFLVLSDAMLEYSLV